MPLRSITYDTSGERVFGVPTERGAQPFSATERENTLYLVAGGMPEEPLFEFEQDMETVEVAQYLRTVADHLESDDEFTLEAGNRSVTLAPPGRVEFEIEVERETSTSGGTADIEIEFELEWDEGATGTGDLTVE